jgi:F-type H+-transporting ATPase subunit b
MMLFAVLAPSGETQVASLARTFGIDWPHLTAQIISFSIVCALLYRLAYKPVLAMLAARREQIAQGLANTEKINAALAAIAETRRNTMAQAHTDATRVITEAREVAARVRALETQRAAAAAEQIMTKARETAAREHERMLLDLRHELGHLVVKTTAAVTGRILTAEDQRRLAEETRRHLS